MTPPILLLERNPRTGAVRAVGPARHFQGYRLPGEWDGIRQGVWAEWQWDGNELTVRNDRLGFSPLFWFATATRVGVSPSLAALVPNLESRELDDDALAVFLRFRNFIGEDTPFRQVRSLPPGATLRWSQGVTRLDALGPLQFEPEAGGRRRRQPEYPAVLREAISRALSAAPGRLALPLSGGLDSRLMLFSMLDLGVTPELCVTLRHHPPRTDLDVELAAEIAAEVGIPHVVLGQNGDRLGQQLGNLSRTHLCTHEHAWYRPLPEFLAAQRFDTFLDGIGGELQPEPILSTQRVNHLIDEGCLADGVAKALVEDYLPALVSPPMLRRWSPERAHAHLVRHARLFEGDANPWGHFRFYARTRRTVALMPWGLHSTGILGLAPFLDKAVVELLGPIPWRELADRTFRREILAHAFPQYRVRPNEEADFSSERGRREILAYGRAVARWAGPRLWRSQMLRPSFLPARLLRAHLDRGYTRELPMACELPLYLLELARWAEGGDPLAHA
ncbi:MAG: hypothetical protein ACREMH_02980 [Gemmatimonadales bacterium]